MVDRAMELYVQSSGLSMVNRAMELYVQSSGLSMVDRAMGLKSMYSYQDCM